MADYYSLLARAVAALPQPAPESRQSVYERARKALFNQLRSIQPPVAEEDIEAEGRALDEAIARLELEIVREQTGKSAPPPRASIETQPPEPEEKRTSEPEKKPDAKKPAKSAEPIAPTPVSPGPSAEMAPAAEKTAPVEEGPAPPQRPPAPLPPLPEPASVSRRMIVIGGVLAAVVALVAVLALQFRERPEDLAKLQPEPSAADGGEGGKIADRIGGDSDAPPPSRAPSEQKTQVVAVAQKAELWVAAPEEAAKVKTYPGTVVWRLDSMPAGQGQPVSPAIYGEIDFPTAKLKTKLVIQKNLDPTLSASHTVNVFFQLAPGSDLKGIKAIGPIQMRRPEAQSGEQVAGVPVPITENAFLIGLLRGNREARNVVLLRAPMVLDLPMQLEDGRAATISLEKGPGGERVFADALDAWSK